MSHMTEAPPSVDAIFLTVRESRPMSLPSKNLAPATFQQVQSPDHFHLIWEEELDELRVALEAIRAARDEILFDWHQLYVLHLGESRALSEHDFLALCGADIDATVDRLLVHDVDQFFVDIGKIGEELATRRVPFAEVVISMHLFEESATRVFPPGAGGHLYRAFDKLSHIRIIALAQSYFGCFSALANAQIRELEQEASRIGADGRRFFRGMVGASKLMRQLYRRIQAAATAMGTVMIVGETGTGKELVARALHDCSPNFKAPFIALNCAALPKDLIESELFGYRRGAFSGASADYAGLFRAADGGTLFLDEITEMGLETQSKLLRSVQERSIRPIGSTAEVKVNVRLIASTNSDPAQAVAQGRFRPDLYYRLYANVLHTPPLRDRLEDIPLLVEHFVTLFNERIRHKPPVSGIDPAALTALWRYHWPGNVRELAGAIESAITFGRSPTITLEDLPAEIAGARPVAPTAAAPSRVVSMVDAERELIHRALDAANGNKTRAARMLAISRKQLYAKIAKYGLADS
jgi:DNA-binding NtrC family response regulator